MCPPYRKCLLSRYSVFIREPNKQKGQKGNTGVNRATEAISDSLSGARHSGQKGFFWSTCADLSDLGLKALVSSNFSVFGAFGFRV